MGAGASAQLSDAQQKEMLEHMREQFRAKCEAMGVDVGQISDADIDAQLRELRKENAALAQKVEEKQQGGGSGVPADVEKLMHEAAWPAIVNDIMECLSIMLLSNDDALFSTLVHQRYGGPSGRVSMSNDAARGWGLAAVSGLGLPLRFRDEGGRGGELSESVGRARRSREARKT